MLYNVINLLARFACCFLAFFHPNLVKNIKCGFLNIILQIRMKTRLLLRKKKNKTRKNKKELPKDNPILALIKKRSELGL